MNIITKFIVKKITGNRYQFFEQNVVNQEQVDLAVRRALEAEDDYRKMYTYYIHNENKIKDDCSKQIKLKENEIVHLKDLIQAKDLIIEKLSKKELSNELEYYKEMELRYNELLERIPKLEKQLEKK